MRHVLACLVAAMLLAACTSPEATPTPTPSARPSTSPATSVTPTPSLTPSPSMTMGYRVEDVQAAEAVYREVRRLIWQVEAQEPPRTVPKDLSKLLEGELKSGVEMLVKRDDHDGLVLIRGEGHVAWTRPVKRNSKDPAKSIVLEGCIDQRNIEFRKKDGATASGIVFRDRAVFIPTDGGWRYSKNKTEEAKSCS